NPNSARAVFKQRGDGAVTEAAGIAGASAKCSKHLLGAIVKADAGWKCANPKITTGIFKNRSELIRGNRIRRVRIVQEMLKSPGRAIKFRKAPLVQRHPHGPFAVAK